MDIRGRDPGAYATAGPLLGIHPSITDPFLPISQTLQVAQVALTPDIGFVNDQRLGGSGSINTILSLPLLTLIIGPGLNAVRVLDTAQLLDVNHLSNIDCLPAAESLPNP